MNALRIYLVRHGNTFETGQTVTYVGKQSDLALSIRGKEQAHELGRVFQSHLVQVDGIYCGHLKRQTEFARILHTYLPLAALKTNESALDELDYGPWEGLTVDQIQAQWPQAYQDWCQRAKWAKGIFNEASHTCDQHIEHWIDSRFQKKERSVLAVSSNGKIRLFLKHHPELWKTIEQKGIMERYKIKTGHYCEVVIQDQRLEVIKWNCPPSP